MSTQNSDCIKVASLKDVPQGKAKAIKVGRRSIALFNVDGKIYATDNQCPHMGYPLTRGSIQNGILTCDWHGYDFDLEGGGCFTGGCDDLETFPVEIRDGEVWIQIGDSISKRRESHLNLLREGLLSTDNWTLAKAIALLLADGVSEDDLLRLCVEHLGWHVASVHGPEGGGDVSGLINGMKVAQRYDGEERIIALRMAARGAAGAAGYRPDVHPLPPPATWEKLERLVRVFSREKQSQGIERCLITARHLGGNDERILPLLYECAVEPHFLGFTDNLRYLGYLEEVVERFGWELSEEVVCNLGSKLIGRGRPEPEKFRRLAIEIFKSMEPIIDESVKTSHLDVSTSVEYDEDALALALVSGDIRTTFEAVAKALKSGVKLEQLITTMVLLAADRLARSPLVEFGPLTSELVTASSVRIAYKCAGPCVAAKALFHTAYQFFTDRWLNIPSRPLSEPLAAGKLEATSEDSTIKLILDSYESLRVDDIRRQVQAYLYAGYTGERLLYELGRAILKDDTGGGVLATLRRVFEEWELIKEHPARAKLLVGLARYATNVRVGKDSQDSARTALRFARGLTTVEIYEGETDTK